MANLGNLYFDILLRDKTDAEVKKIRAKLIKDLESNVTIKNIQIDKTALVNSINNALRGQTFTIDVKTKGGAAVNGNGSLTAGELRAVRAANLINESQAKVALIAARTTSVMQRQQKALNSVASAHQSATEAIRQHASSLNFLNSTGERTTSFFGSVKNELIQLGQVYFWQDFAKSIVNIGGELENQRIAMSSILKDAGKAQSVFDKVQTLAVKSPFGVLQLNSYAKQLTAYSVPYNELYDTMKRLADVSAGVGVSMDRIILAYGQIKAKHVLAGTELRQLTEANLPIIDMLSKQYSAQEGRLVTAAEIYERVSNKQVSFDDVKKAFETMTDKGGQFYNMQEAMSESLKSKWKNLADAIDIMFGSLANSKLGDGLKSIAETLTNMTYQWLAMGMSILSAVAAIKLYRLGAMLANRALDANMMKTFYTARNANGGYLKVDTKAEQSVQQATVNSNNAQAMYTVRQLQNARQLNSVKAAYLVMTKQVNEYEGKILKRLYGWSDATYASYQNAGKFRTGLQGVAIVAQRIGVALRAIAGQLAWTAAFAAVGYVIGKVVQRASELKEQLENIREKGGETARSLSGIQDEINTVNPEKSGSSELQEAINKMKTALKDYYPRSASEEFEKAFGKDANGKVKTLSESFKSLKASVESATKAVTVQRTMSEALAGINDDMRSWGGLLDGDSLSGRAEDYADALADLDKFVRNHAKANQEFAKALSEVKKNYPEYAKLLEKNKIGSNDISSQISMLFESGNRSWQGMFVRNIPYNLATKFYNGLSDDLNDSMNSLAASASRTADRFVDAMNVKGIKKGSAEWNKAAQESVENFLDQNNVMDERVRQKIRDVFIAKKIFVHVEGQFSGADDVLTGLQKYVSEKFGGMFDNDVKNGGGLANTLDALKNKTKENRKEVDALVKALKKMGITADGKSEINAGAIADETVRDTVQQYNSAVKKYNAGKGGLDFFGVSLDDAKKTNKKATDKALESAKTELAQLREAWQEYKKLKSYLGDDKARETMEESPFKNFFKDGDLTEERYTKWLEALKSKMSAKSTKERQAFVLEINKLEFGLKEDALKKAAEDLQKRIQTWLSDFSSRWDLYKSVKNTSGNESLAKLAFGDYEMWDEEALELKKKFQSKFSGIFNDWSMDETDAKNLFSKMGQPELLSLYTSIQKKIRETGKEYLTMAAQAEASMKTTEDKIWDLQKKIDELRGKIASGLVPDEVGTKILEQYYNEINKLQEEAFKLSDVYKRIFGNIDYMGANKLRDILKEIDYLLQNARKDGNGYVLTSTSGATYRATEGDLKSLRDRWVSISNQLSKIDPFAQMYKSVKKLFSKGATSDEKQQAIKNLGDSVQTVTGYVNDLTSAFGSMFRQQGHDDIADQLELVGTISSGLNSVMQGFQNGGVIGGGVTLLSSVADIATKISEIKNAKLERQIKASQRRYTLLENYLNNVENKGTYTLGNIYNAKVDAQTLNKQKAALISLRDLQKEINRAKSYTSRNDTERLETLQKEYDLLKKLNTEDGGRTLQSQIQVNLAEKYAQVRELYYQRDKEWKKSNTSQETINDLNQQIQEALQDIQDYEEQVAETLYGINLKSWADDLSDALVSAWLSGEDAADAYSEKVGDIMTDMMKKWLSIQYIQPVMKQVQTMLFGSDGQGGFMEDGMLSEDEIAKIAGEITGLQGNIGAWSETISNLVESLKKQGVEFSDNSTGLSKSIQGVTESTADILASYINAMRADVSLSREYLRELAQESFSGMNAIAQQQLSELRAISSNTLRNADIAAELRDLIKQNTVLGKGFKIA